MEKKKKRRDSCLIRSEECSLLHDILIINPTANVY